MEKYSEELKSIFDMANVGSTDPTCCDEWLQYMEKCNRPVLITEIVESVPGFPVTQKADAYARRLSEIGVLNIIVEGGRKYYSLPKNFGNEYLHKIKIENEAICLTKSMLDELDKTESNEDLIKRIRTEEEVEDLVGKAQQTKRIWRRICVTSHVSNRMLFLLKKDMNNCLKKGEQLLEIRTML